MNDYQHSRTIEIRRHIRKIDAIFREIRVQFAISGNQLAKIAKMRQMDTPGRCIEREPGYTYQVLVPDTVCWSRLLFFP